MHCIYFNQPTHTRTHSKDAPRSFIHQKQSHPYTHALQARSCTLCVLTALGKVHFLFSLLREKEKEHIVVIQLCSSISYVYLYLNSRCFSLESRIERVLLFPTLRQTILISCTLLFCVALPLKYQLLCGSYSFLFLHL